jgi:hypothetical protein
VVYEVSGKFSVAFKATRTPVYGRVVKQLEVVGPHLCDICSEVDLDTPSWKITNWGLKCTSLEDNGVALERGCKRLRSQIERESTWGLLFELVGRINLYSNIQSLSRLAYSDIIN